MFRVIASIILLALARLHSTAAEDRKAKILSDPKEVETAGGWIYNDLQKGFTQAKTTGRPMLVVVRCLP